MCVRALLVKQEPEMLVGSTADCFYVPHHCINNCCIIRTPLKTQIDDFHCGDKAVLVKNSTFDSAKKKKKKIVHSEEDWEASFSFKLDLMVKYSQKTNEWRVAALQRAKKYFKIMTNPDYLLESITQLWDDFFFYFDFESKLNEI